MHHFLLLVVSVNCLLWNTGVAPDHLAISLSSGDVLLISAGKNPSQLIVQKSIEASSSESMSAYVPYSLPPSLLLSLSSSLLVCWSPKGKQIVVGTKSGKIIQLGTVSFVPKRIINFSFLGPPNKERDTLSKYF